MTVAPIVRQAARASLRRGEACIDTDAGFSVIDLVMGMTVIAIVMLSLTYVMVNSVVDVAYNRQRSTALTLANQAIEEVRALSPAVITSGMKGASDATWSQDPNVGGNCFEEQPLDVNGAKAASNCGSTTWTTPTCPSVASGPPAASSLPNGAPLSPHLACYTFGGRTYGVAVYLTGDPTALPLTAWAVVWWLQPARNGLENHVVTNMSLSDCLLVGTTCGATS
jgi:type II secretory pathway pseudopilin PulG